MEEFFLGIKEQTFMFRVDQLNVTCAVSAVWRDIQQGESCACGAEGRLKLSKETGISRRDSVAMKESWETTLGGAAVLAQIKASIENTLETVVSWETHDTIETEIKFVAPKCGRRTELVYQLQRNYAFTFEKPRLFSPKVWSLNLQEKTNRYHYKPLIEDPVGECNCPIPEAPSVEGMPVTVTLENVSMSIAVQRRPNNPIPLFWKHDFEWFPTDFLAKHIPARASMTLPTDQLPEVVKFLAEERLDLRSHRADQVACLLSPDFTSG